jgi:hypothetical protein
MPLTKLSTGEFTMLILFSLLLLSVSFVLFYYFGIIKDSNKKYYYNWIVIYVASIIGLTGLVMFAMPIYQNYTVR